MIFIMVFSIVAWVFWTTQSWNTNLKSLNIIYSIFKFVYFLMGIKIVFDMYKRQDDNQMLEILNYHPWIL